ncbi:hypothetical protein GGR57DRAFT_497135 [Xylariaceae sp. FL1272]|nr:hypothetical protein GGR57DRAFT_497135 [Xylariaceae sp. FL1272]
MNQLNTDYVFISHEDLADTAKCNSQCLDDISTFIESIADQLWTINKKIHSNPELGYREFIAHETLTSFFKARPGWAVTPSAYEMETAWVAVFDSGRKGPVVSFNVEMDALEGIGHACGHNLIATASVAAGLATAEILKQRKLGGKVVLFGTPAEEGGGGKIRLLKAGAYKDHKVDVNLLSHPGIVKNHAIMRTAAYTSFKVEYFGREAHAAASPWEGINALDALIIAYNAISVLRQQTMPGDVMQCNITNGGARPNIIHAYAAGNFVVRANTQSRLAELEKKVQACLAAGASASGARLKTTPVMAYADHVPNRVLADHYRRYFNELSSEDLIPDNPELEEIEGRTMASTDQGNISYAMPSLNVGFRIPAGPGNAGPRESSQLDNPGFAETAGTKEAFKRCLRVGKAMAGVGVDILQDCELLGDVKREWKRDVGRDD